MRHAADREVAIFQDAQIDDRLRRVSSLTTKAMKQTRGRIAKHQRSMREPNQSSSWPFIEHVLQSREPEASKPKPR